MIGYVYWFFIAALTLGAFYLLGYQLKQWLPGLVVAAVIAVAGTLLYYFYLEQMFVKRWGGTMTIEVPEGQRHIGSTWKQDHLWIENYDPQTDTCIFTEYSRGNVLEGKVRIENCDPLTASPQ